MKLVHAAALALLVGSSALGCGAAHELAKSATTGAMEAGIEGVSEPATQQKLVESIDSERVEDATKRLADGIVDGSLDTFSNPERLARVQRFTESAMQPVVRTIGGAAAQALDATFARFFSEETQRQLKAVVRTMVNELVVQVSELAAREVRSRRRA